MVTARHGSRTDGTVASRRLACVSVTPQTNEPEVPEGRSPAAADDPSLDDPSLDDLFVSPGPARTHALQDQAAPARSSSADPASAAPSPVCPSAATDPTGRQADPSRLEARVVERLVRHVSPWSVLKVSTLLYLSMYVVLLLAGTGLWMIASSRGLVGSFESFMDELLAEENFRVDGSQIFRVCSVVGIVGVAITAALTVLFSIIFNLISDITGGFRVSVVELETARPRRARAPR